jgi:hypothetical protein
MDIIKVASMEAMHVAAIRLRLKSVCGKEAGGNVWLRLGIHQHQGVGRVSVLGLLM